MTKQPETLFEFPCLFPIKVMGMPEMDLESIVKVALTAVGVDSADVKLDSRLSRGGRYTSVTATFEAKSKAQLDSLYHSLTTHPAVKIVL